MTLIDANKVELELARKLFYLVSHEWIFFSNYNEDIKDWDEGIYPAISIGDIFVPGADAESLHLEDIDLYIELCKKFPRFPEYAWCIAKRSEKPWRYAATDEEKLAVEYACELLGVENPLVEICPENIA